MSISPIGAAGAASRAMPAGRAKLYVQELPWRDPAALFAHWCDDPYMAFLDGAASADPRGRYSYLAVEPFRILAAVDSRVSIDGLPVPGDPFTVLERELDRYRIEPGEAPVPFAGGAVGFLGYELGRCLEKLPARHANELAIPDMVVAFYDVVIAFDQVERRAWLLSSGLPADSDGARAARAERRARAVFKRLRRPVPVPSAAPRSPVGWTPDLDPAEYQARVASLLEHIRAGDIYQANFTARHLIPRPAGTAADLYRALRRSSPAPFAAYLACGPRLAVASASPERFLRVDTEGRIETRPIKGTRPRGGTAEEDARLAAELAASEKDRAENLMIVDLMRNDISRVAAIGSVAVPSLCAVESFPSVHHLVSAVEALLRPGAGRIDLLRATFPGGSITGAPKLRAMALIDAVEASRRGPYCGSIAWFGFDGAMDSSIVIRTLTITPELVVAQAGGGIVADSDPAAEYEEMMVKIRPLLRAIECAAP
jgi:para-aminobenzoate synthetase component 1